MLIYCTRWDRDETVPFFYVWDETRLKILATTETRPRVSVSFYSRPRREPSFNVENDWILALLFFKNTHPDQDETEWNWSKQDKTRTKMSQNLSSETRSRWDKFHNFVRHREETESLSTFSLETEMRPRLLSFTGRSKFFGIWLLVVQSNTYSIM